MKVLGANASLDTFTFKESPANWDDSVLARMGRGLLVPSSLFANKRRRTRDTLARSALPARISSPNSRLTTDPCQVLRNPGKIVASNLRVHSGQISNVKHTVQPGIRGNYNAAQLSLATSKRSCTVPSCASRSCGDLLILLQRNFVVLIAQLLTRLLQPQWNL